MADSVRRYTKEFREEAIKLAFDMNNVSQAAKELRIPEATLYSWVKKSKSEEDQTIESIDGTIAHVNVRELLDENKALRKQLLRLEQEKAILKKAATYFAKELG